MYVYSDTFSCITELYEKVVRFRGFFFKLGFFAGFSLNIIIYGGRINEAAMGAAVLPVKEPKKTGARSAQARTRGHNPQVYKYMSEFD
jgi:hypothetical protein